MMIHYKSVVIWLKHILSWNQKRESLLGSMYFDLKNILIAILPTKLNIQNEPKQKYHI